MAITEAQIKTVSDDKAKEKKVMAILADFAGTPEDLIPMLQACQRTMGYLPLTVLLEIADLTGLPAAKVFGVATFYAQFRLQPVGAHVIRVCRGTACHVRGSHHICDQLQRRYQILPGETTPDRRFTLETVACFGSCALAPVMVLDETVHGRMGPAKAVDVIENLNDRHVPDQTGTSLEEDAQDKDVSIEKKVSTP